MYPSNQRGTEAPVGVGLESAPLWAKGRCCLVGSTGDSWGICLRSKRAFHRGKALKKYPLHQRPLTDTFYMYLDADSGTLMFGSNEEFYGTAFAGISGRPLYPMIGSCMQGSTMTLIYRGEGQSQYLYISVTTECLRISRARKKYIYICNRLSNTEVVICI